MLRHIGYIACINGQVACTSVVAPVSVRRRVNIVAAHGNGNWRPWYSAPILQDTHLTNDACKRFPGLSIEYMSMQECVLSDLTCDHARIEIGRPAHVNVGFNEKCR